jgi:flagellar hook-associated protein 2
MATSGTSALTSTGSISSAGLGSGLDVNSIVTQLMAVEKRPLTQLQTTAGSFNATLSEMAKLQSNFAAMRDKAQALNNVDLWNATTASSSDGAAVTVSTGTNATVGSYAVAVSKLALSQTVTSSALADSAATLGTGTLTIELGSYGSGTPAADFTAKAGSAPVTIAIGAGDTSLASVRDKINSASAGVVASIVTDASGARLSLRSAATGAENAFRISASEASDDGNPGTGLSMLAYDASATSSTMTRSTAAGNAELTVNGIALSSGSNTLSNVVDGLSLTLGKVTTGDVNVTVAADTGAVKTAITNFVTAFNALASFIHTDTAYNAESKTAGPLQGDQATLSLQNQLRSVLNLPSSASGTFGTLSQIGITLKTDGTLDTSAGKLDSALGNLSELKKLMSGDGANSAAQGFSKRFQTLGDVALGSDGTFASRKAGLQANLDRNTKQQDALQVRLTATESRLRKQYQSLDTKMASLNSLSSYMTQQLSKL